jgi:hypothetical protein
MTIRPPSVDDHYHPARRLGRIHEDGQWHPADATDVDGRELSGNVAADLERGLGERQLTFPDDSVSTSNLVLLAVALAVTVVALVLVWPALRRAAAAV